MMVVHCPWACLIPWMKTYTPKCKVSGNKARHIITYTNHSLQTSKTPLERARRGRGYVECVRVPPSQVPEDGVKT